MRIRSAKTALIVVDMQNGFCDEAGSVTAIGLPASRLRPAIAGCVSLVSAARAAKVPIIYTRYVYRPDYLDGGLMAHELLPDLRDGKHSSPAHGTPTFFRRWHRPLRILLLTRIDPALFLEPTSTPP